MFVTQTGVGVVGKMSSVASEMDFWDVSKLPCSS